MLPGVILGGYQCSWPAYGQSAHNGTRGDTAQWVWSSLDLWRTLALPWSPLLSTARIRQNMRVRATIRQHLPPKEDALTATGRRDARGTSTETNLSKGAVQWSWGVSRNTKSRGSTMRQCLATPCSDVTHYRPWNEVRLSRWNAFSTLRFTLLKLSAYFVISLLCCSSKCWIVNHMDQDSEPSQSQKLTVPWVLILKVT